jgi:hypothetical protein
MVDYRGDCLCDLRDRRCRSMMTEQRDMKAARPEDIPKATHESVQEFFCVKVRTYVLDDGRRIINADDFHKLMASMGMSGADD